MKRASLWIVAAAICATGAEAADSLLVNSPRFSAVVRQGTLAELKAPPPSPCEFVRPGRELRGCGVHRVAETHYASGPAEIGAIGPGDRFSAHYDQFPGLPDGTLDATYHVDPSSGDLVVSQRAHGQAAGVWGVSWTIADIPPEYAILVPGCSGLRLTADTPTAPSPATGRRGGNRGSNRCERRPAARNDPRRFSVLPLVRPAGLVYEAEFAPRGESVVRPEPSI